MKNLNDNNQKTEIGLVSNFKGIIEDRYFVKLPTCHFEF